MGTMTQNHENQKDVESTAPVLNQDTSGDTKAHTKKEKKSKSPLKMPEHMPVGPGNFWNNILSTVLFLIALSFIYSYATDKTGKPEELSISQIAEQVKQDEVKEILVKGSTCLLYTSLIPYFFPKHWHHKNQI